MLQAASRWIEEGDAGLSQPVEVTAPPVLPPVAGGSVAPARYGQRRRPNMALVAVIILLHGAIIAALIQARTHVSRVKEEKLVLVDLSSPPPPPAAEAPPPPPSAPPVVAPPPVVQVPVPPAPSIQTAPEPVPAPAAAAPAPPSPAPPAVVAAPAPPSIVQAGDLGAQMVSGKPPRYPLESRRRHEQGTVVLGLTLALDGSVETIVIAQSSGSPRLDDAARDAVKGWRWKPILRAGQPVRARGVVEIPFILRTGAA